MSLTGSLKEEVTSIRKEYMIKTVIIKSFTDKNQLAVPLSLQNEHPNSESNISLANNEKINITKISTKNEHHRDNSSLLAKENNKVTERKNDEKEKPKLKNSAVKNILILGDSIIKNVDGWRLNRRIKSIASVRLISGAKTKTMKHHIMGCLEDESRDTIPLHHGRNNLRSEESPEKIASNIINVDFFAKNEKEIVYVSGLTVRNNKYDRKRKEVKVILKKKCNDENLSFIDNGNINPRMLNKSGLHLHTIS